MVQGITNNVDTRLPIGVSKTMTARTPVALPPILSFKTPLFKERATLRVKKFKRSDNIAIAGEIDDDYIDTIEEEIESPPEETNSSRNFFLPVQKQKRKTKILKDCYIIDYIQSPKMHAGLGTEALKGLAEKAMFDDRIQGRIVTFSAPVYRESSPALFFYKLGFRFLERSANEYMIDCLIKNKSDLPPQTGMMYLPKSQLHKLIRYGDVF